MALLRMIPKVLASFLLFIQSTVDRTCGIQVQSHCTVEISMFAAAVLTHFWKWFSRDLLYGECEISTYGRSHSKKKKKKKQQIGDRALPQWGFGLSTPSGEERQGATLSNTAGEHSEILATPSPISEHNISSPQGTQTTASEGQLVSKLLYSAASRH
jgi:hypothetical protein